MPPGRGSTNIFWNFDEVCTYVHKRTTMEFSTYERANEMQKRNNVSAVLFRKNQFLDSNTGTSLQLEILLYIESIVNYVELFFFQFYSKIKKRKKNQQKERDLNSVNVQTPCVGKKRKENERDTKNDRKKALDNDPTMKIKIHVEIPRIF